MIHNHMYRSISIDWMLRRSAIVILARAPQAFNQIHLACEILNKFSLHRHVCIDLTDIVLAEVYQGLMKGVRDPPLVLVSVCLGISHD